MNQSALARILLCAPFLAFNLAAAHAEADQVCIDAEPTETVQIQSSDGVREEQEYTQGTLEWWFEGCYGVVVKQFCRPRDTFRLSQSEGIDLEKEAIWLRVLGQAPLPKLNHLKEPDEKVDEAYRFLWRPTFFSSPTVITVSRSGDKRAFYASQFCNQRHTSRTLTVEEWNKIKGLLDEAQFWTLPKIGGSSGLDGGDWLIEGYSDPRYHVVSRWSPNGPLRKFGTYLLELSGFDPPVIQ